MNSVVISGLRQGLCRLQHLRMMCLQLAKGILLLLWEGLLVGTIEMFVLACDNIGTLFRKGLSRFNNKDSGPTLLYPACFQQRPKTLDKAHMIPLTHQKAPLRTFGKRSEIL